MNGNETLLQKVQRWLAVWCMNQTPNVNSRGLWHMPMPSLLQGASSRVVSKEQPASRTPWCRSSSRFPIFPQPSPGHLTSLVFLPSPWRFLLVKKTTNQPKKTLNIHIYIHILISKGVGFVVDQTSQRRLLISKGAARLPAVWLCFLLAASDFCPLNATLRKTDSMLFSFQYLGSCKILQSYDWSPSGGIFYYPLRQVALLMASDSTLKSLNTVLARLYMAKILDIHSQISPEISMMLKRSATTA